MFKVELEKEVLIKIKLKPSCWWRCTVEIFFLCNYTEEKLKEFIENLNETHPTIKFTTELSQTSANFLDVNLSPVGGKVTTNLYVKPTGSHQFIYCFHVTLITAKKESIQPSFSS